ncbi:glycosyltransferase [Kiloniella sp. EL199]|uniref:glycosyltransferase n=1 Tax=Kiloniella sp. EL199 TaxID=2107581 RepID=UPI000EA0048E|nr:glycosyltransferase [Kiloniella sp. EL199]
MTAIFHVITSLDEGGAERMLTRVAVNGVAELSNQKQVVISLKGLGIYGEELVKNGVEVFSLNLDKGNRVAALWKLYKIFQKYKPVMVMTWLYHADFIGSIFSIFFGVKSIIWNVRCSNIDFSKYSKLTWLLVMILSYFSHIPKAIIVNSKVGQKEHEKLGYQPKEWIYIPNGFDVDEFSPDASLRQQVRKELGVGENAVVGIIARTDPQKDYDTFLKASVLLAKKEKSVKFLLVGKGTDKLLIPEELKDIVICLGARRDVAALLQGMDIFVLSSAYGEGFPNVLGEAMAVGVPCVTTDVGDAAELVQGIGEIVEPQKAEMLSSTIEDLLAEGKDGLSRRVTLGRDRIVNCYSISHITDQYLNVYNSALGDSNGN